MLHLIIQVAPTELICLCLNVYYKQFGSYGAVYSNYLIIMRFHTIKLLFLLFAYLYCSLVISNKSSFRSELFVVIMPAVHRAPLGANCYIIHSNKNFSFYLTSKLFNISNVTKLSLIKHLTGRSHGAISRFYMFITNSLAPTEQ